MSAYMITYSQGRVVFSKSVKYLRKDKFYLFNKVVSTYYALKTTKFFVFIGEWTNETCLYDNRAGSSTPLAYRSLEGLPSMATSTEPDFSHGSSGLKKYVSQERESQPFMTGPGSHIGSVMSALL